jgi:hypothetical protein
MTDDVTSEPIGFSIYHDRFPNRCPFCGSTSLTIQILAWLSIKDAVPQGFIIWEDIIIPKKKGALVLCDCGGQFWWRPRNDPDKRS